MFKDRVEKKSLLGFTPTPTHTPTQTKTHALSHTHALTHMLVHTCFVLAQMKQLHLLLYLNYSHYLLMERTHTPSSHMHSCCTCTHTHYLSHFFSLLLPNVFPHSVSLMRLLLPPTHPCTHSHSHAHSLHPIKHIFRKTLKQFGSVHPSINHVNHLQTSHRGKKNQPQLFCIHKLFLKI